MLIFPAIDIKDGQVVRLKQGDYQQVTRYHSDPISQAKTFAEQGAEWLHVVDLDAAKSGHPVNRAIVADLAKKSGLKVQIGGGIRSVEMARIYFEEGVERVVVGTQAVRHPQFLSELAKHWPEKIALGLDTKNGQIAVQGWTETVALSLDQYLQQAPLDGVACLIFTDIGRDGMLLGPNLQALREVLAVSPIPVIASGGVSQLADLKNLTELKDEKLQGIIIGKALYEGQFTLKEALEIVTQI